ncbi:hypothetical protein BDQ12DRAFT_699775 [Crucibulum laeve]|uniref:Uncharacterized protein n=1 Tax=Crucibulum laeve TaxID=68775 RepID=A0A5C3LUH7_9AGAR|nr:hypothetical protein BDQ12DRAFT_699775 [Crucibulum laeve]
MSGKTLSTGTLSLRFMQNAQRAKQLKEVELERAEVKDDGQWEVSKEVKEAWRVGSGSTEMDAVIHEASYLPFLFSESSATSNSSQYSGNRPKGRRVFNKKGEEVVDESKVVPLSGESAPMPHEPSSKGRKPHPHPVSISASGSSGLRGFDQFKQFKDTKTAKQEIFDNAPVGDDLRPPPAIKSIFSAKPTSNTFLKPSGVDDPLETKPRAAMTSSPSIIEGARSKKMKRERDPVGEPSHDDTKKPKRKKKAQ